MYMDHAHSCILVWTCIMYMYMHVMYVCTHSMILKTSGNDVIVGDCDIHTHEWQ